MIFGVQSFDVQIWCSVIFNVQYLSALGHSAFGHSTLGPIRCSVIQCSVIRCSVFQCTVIRCSVIQCSVFRRSVGESIIHKKSKLSVDFTVEKPALTWNNLWKVLTFWELYTFPQYKSRIGWDLLRMITESGLSRSSNFKF
jgi:hypothetical protein